MEKFAIGLALGCLGGALITANNYKMRMLVRKGQEEVQSKIDKMLDEKLQTLDEKAQETKDKVLDKAEAVNESIKDLGKKKSKEK